MNKTWQKAQEWEASWHGTAVNSFNEELKQLEYAKLMGIKRTPNLKTPYSFDLEGKSILDIGSGAYSLLLKCTNFKDSVVSDPLMNDFPEWVIKRYITHGLKPAMSSGEDLDGLKRSFDEVWFYNVLEHVYDPKKIIDNAKRLGKIVRVFEWLDTKQSIGHLQLLTESKMNKWLNGNGKVQKINKNGAVGKCFSGIFRGDHYEE